MTMEPGGRADKLGNEYERLWGVHCLLLVLAGEYRSVLSEGLGDDEPGVDFWVQRPDGTRQLQQCKRENGDEGRWSIADLQRVEVLQRAWGQLQRDSRHRFAFVSSDPAPHFEDLAERTAHANSSPESYVDHCTTTSRALRKSFENLCRYLALDMSVPNGRAAVFDFLSRVARLHFPRGRQARVEVERLCRTIVRTDDAASVVEGLEALLKEHFGNEIHAAELRSWLTKRGLRLLDLAGDLALHARVERLREHFLSSVGSTLIGATLLRRTEAGELCGMLTRREKPVRLALVHGRAGTGKSGVLYEVALALRDAGVPWLGLRLDRQSPAVSTDRYGRDVLDLQASPVTCLSAVAGQRCAVLVLDQIDAIRWTSAHSADAWGVCEGLIAEALATPNVCVVVGCRSFDLTDDPGFAALRKREGVHVLEVHGLPEADVRCVVGAQWGGMSARERSLLSNPQALFMWWTLAQENAAPSGVARLTDLLRAYWHHIRLRLGVMGALTDGDWVLREVVAHMDQRGCLTAPQALVSARPLAIAALSSLGVLRAEGRHLVFAHQSYLDYLVVEERLRVALGDPSTVCAWLLGGDQSLFYRPRLQQLLTLLREDDPRGFLRVVESLLGHAEVRFHLKVLALRVLGALADPREQELEFVRHLLSEPAWRDHATEHVLFGSSAWVRAAWDCGRLGEWLGSRDQELADCALWLLRSVNSEAGGLLVSAAAAVGGLGSDWGPRLAWAFPLRAENDPPELFDLRLQLVRDGVSSVEFVAWDQVALGHPVRALRLLHAWVAWLLSAATAGGALHARRQVPGPGVPGHEALVGAARQAPAVALDLLPGACRQLEQLSAREVAFDRRFVLGDTLEILEPLVEAACVALAIAEPQAFVVLAQRNAEGPGAALERGLLLGHAELPAAQADHAVAWTLAPGRLHLEREDEPQRPLACAVVERMAPACGGQSYERLERAILAHADERERQSFVHAVREDAGHRNELGRSQLALLGALPEQRRSAEATRRLLALRAKFNGRPPFDPRSLRLQGCVVSPISERALPHLADRDWIRLMSSQLPRRGARWRRVREGVLSEASHHHFARAFGEAAHQAPERFADLALGLPATDATPLYLCEALRALARKAPPGNASAEARQDWRPARPDQLERLLLRAGYAEERELAVAALGLVDAYPELDWSGAALALVVRYAVEHPHPLPGVPLDRPTLEPRALATRAIAALLFHEPQREVALTVGVRSVLGDPSALVRREAVEVCTALLRVDRARAVATLLQAAAHQDDRLLATRHVGNFLTYAIRSHWRHLAPLIDRMVASTDDGVAGEGAAWATRVWLAFGGLETVAAACARGATAQRSGYVRVLVHDLDGSEPDSRCAQLLPPYFDDPEPSVREAAARLFLGRSDRDGVYAFAHAPRLAEAFVQSVAFRDRPDILLGTLERFGGSVLPYGGTILAAAAAFAGELAPASRDVRRGVAGAVGGLVPLILRLQWAARERGDEDTVRQCLDAIDALLEARVGLMRSVLDRLEDQEFAERLRPRVR